MTTMAGDPCWASQTNSGVAPEYFIFFYWLRVRYWGVSPTCCRTGEPCDLSPPPPAYMVSSKVARRIYLVATISTGTFEVTANPCNHGNICKGSSETAGRPLRKYSGGELRKLRGQHPTERGGCGASCQGPGPGLAAIARSFLGKGQGCSP